MNIKINHQIKVPIYKQIARQMKGLMHSGEISQGSTLPSERAMAKILGVHRNTVIKAYSELKDEELIESQQGIGYTVVSKRTEDEKAIGINRGQTDGREGHNQGFNRSHSQNYGSFNTNGDIFSGHRGKSINWTNQIKEEYLDMEVAFDDLFQQAQRENVISMGSGLPSNEIYNREAVAEDIAKIIMDQGKPQYFYSPYQGDRELRQKLVSFLSTKGIKATIGEIQILTETNQALDFIVALLVKAGDVILMEEPVSPDAYRTVELAGARIITIPVDEDGIQCQLLEALIQQHHPRFIYVNSSFHDPTGNILSQERRKQILDISEKTRTIIVEEDAASELVYSGTKLLPMKAYDALNNVIYIYSFSLSFMPGLSLAFVVANKELIRSLSYLVSVRMVAMDWLTQKLIAKYLGDGSYYQMLDRFRQNYALKQELVCRKLDQMKMLGVEYERPRGGVYIWCKLAEELDSKDFTAAAHKNGVALIPGYVFYPLKNGGRNAFRLNYSYESLDRLEEGMEILQDTMARELAHKKRRYSGTFNQFTL